MDGDGDGQITLEEFAAAASLLGLAPAPRDEEHDALERRALAIFDQIDVDGSGTLDRSEIQDLMRRLDPSQSEDGVQLLTQRLMSILDEDGDGTVTREEFTLAVTSGQLDGLLQVKRKRGNCTGAKTTRS